MPLLATSAECRAGTKLVEFDDRVSGGEIEALRTERALAKLAKSADKTLREAQAETIESSGETLVQENHNRLRRERQQATREIRVAAIKRDTSIFR